MTLLPILRRIQRPTTQGHSSNAMYENSQKIETYWNINTILNNQNIFLFHFMQHPQIINSSNHGL